jgi:uncharacterized protein (TIGR02466 family)
MIENLFFTPIFAHQFSGVVLDKIQTEIFNALPAIRSKEGDSPWGDAVTTTFNFNRINDIDTYNLSILKDAIGWAIKEYAKELNYTNPIFKMSESWVNFCNSGGFQYDHSHPRTRISGVYYYQTNTEDGKIRFQNPNPNVNFSLFPADGTNIDAVSYRPAVGRLLLFPSWLTHRVNLNTTEHERISIAFNLE